LVLNSDGLDFGRVALAFVDELERLCTTNEVVARLTQMIASFGFERLILTGLPEERFDEAVLGKRWPLDYFERYTRENYVRVSPLVRRCRTSAVPFRWQRQDFENEPDPRAGQVMHEAAEAGMSCGFLVPVHSIKGFDACVSMTGERAELPIHAKPGLHLIALYAFERLRALRETEPFATLRKKRPLTPREREVLTWIAHGKTAWEVGEILAIAKRTVDEHVQAAGRKLGAKNRTHAVALALRSGCVRI
jgi:LuxR family quorum sensing-dependent transcriptional regulator